MEGGKNDSQLRSMHHHLLQEALKAPAEVGMVGC